MTHVISVPAPPGAAPGHPLWHACPVWCIAHQADVDPGVRLHQGQPRTVGGYEVRVERFDGEHEAAGEVRVFIGQHVDCDGLLVMDGDALTLADTRLLALALLDAAFGRAA